VLIILVFVFIVFRACVGVSSQGPNSSALPKVAEYQTVAPAIKQAPYVVTTGTRIYYVNKFLDKNNVVTLQQYYIYDKNTWQMKSKPLDLDRKYYGQITIVKR